MRSSNRRARRNGSVEPPQVVGRDRWLEVPVEPPLLVEDGQRVDRIEVDALARHALRLDGHVAATAPLASRSRRRRRRPGGRRDRARGRARRPSPPSRTTSRWAGRDRRGPPRRPAAGRPAAAASRPAGRADRRAGSGSRECAPRGGRDAARARSPRSDRPIGRPRPARAGWLEVSAHAVEVGHQLRTKARGEVATRRARLSRLDGPALLPPAREAAVEDGHPVVAEDAEGPPHSRRGRQVLPGVDDDPVAVPDAESADRLAEGRRVRAACGAAPAAGRRSRRCRSRRRPGTCACRYSARASRLRVGRYHVASRTRSVGSPR